MCLFACQNYNFIPKLSIFTCEKNIMSHINWTFFTFFILWTNSHCKKRFNMRIKLFHMWIAHIHSYVRLFFTCRNKTMQTKSHNCASSHLNSSFFIREQKFKQWKWNITCEMGIFSNFLGRMKEHFHKRNFHFHTSHMSRCSLMYFTCRFEFLHVRKKQNNNNHRDYICEILAFFVPEHTDSLIINYQNSYFSASITILIRQKRLSSVLLEQKKISVGVFLDILQNIIHYRLKLEHE